MCCLFRIFNFVFFFFFNDDDEKEILILKNSISNCYSSLRTRKEETFPHLGFFQAVAEFNIRIFFFFSILDYTMPDTRLSEV